MLHYLPVHSQKYLIFCGKQLALLQNREYSENHYRLFRFSRTKSLDRSTTEMLKMLEEMIINVGFQSSVNHENDFDLIEY